MKVKEGSEKAGLKLNIKKTRIMASSSITSWHISHLLMGKSWNSERLFLGASKSLQMVTAAMKLRGLPLGRKVMTTLNNILKSKSLLTKVGLVKAMVFPVFMYGCEGWTIKKLSAEEFMFFKLWYWRRPLRVPWTAAHQASLSIINPQELAQTHVHQVSDAIQPSHPDYWKNHSFDYTELCWQNNVSAF